MIEKITQLDILITIFNQEEIIERVLYGVLRNTTTPFNLILVFDGCTDRTQPRAEKYLRRFTSKYLQKVSIHVTPNLFETRANNYGFKLSTSDYLITIQDDMVVRECGWEKRLTFPLRKFNDVFAVSARSAQDLLRIEGEKEVYANQAAFELNTLPRDVFAVRDIGIRGPLAFKMKCLRELNYLNEKYAPCALDDSELSLRAWRDKRWKIGCFGINYLSKKEWSKVSAPDSTMKTWESWRRNLKYIETDFKEYLESGVKHTEDIVIPEKEIDYEKGFSQVLRRIGWIFRYPPRLDKRRLKVLRAQALRRSAYIAKAPFLFILRLVLGKRFYETAEKEGFKAALKSVVRK